MSTPHHTDSSQIDSGTAAIVLADDAFTALDASFCRLITAAQPRWLCSGAQGGAASGGYVVQADKYYNATQVCLESKILSCLRVHLSSHRMLHISQLIIHSALPGIITIKMLHHPSAHSTPSHPPPTMSPAELPLHGAPQHLILLRFGFRTDPHSPRELSCVRGTGQRHPHIPRGHPQRSVDHGIDNTRHPRELLATELVRTNICMAACK